MHRNRVLASYLKAIGCIIPLMDATYANYYTRELFVILLREFRTPDEEMKKIVLKVVARVVQTEGVSSEYIKSQVLEVFFKSFWIRRMALDKRNSALLIDTTVALASGIGGKEIVSRLVVSLKDESEILDEWPCLRLLRLYVS